MYIVVYKNICCLKVFFVLKYLWAKNIFIVYYIYVLKIYLLSIRGYIFQKLLLG